VSRATCRIYAADGSGPIAWSVYEGTSDCQPRNLSASSEKAWEDSRVVNGWSDYCGDQGVPVIIHTCYGAGWEWRGRACLEHMTLLEGDGCMESNLSDVWDAARRDVALFSSNACYERHKDPTFAPKGQKTQSAHEEER
jgi:hypothetical protein